MYVCRLNASNGVMILLLLVRKGNMYYTRDVRLVLNKGNASRNHDQPVEQRRGPEVLPETCIKYNEATQFYGRKLVLSIAFQGLRESGALRSSYGRNSV